MTREEAQRLIQEKMLEIRRNLKECVTLADEHRIMLDLGHCGPYQNYYFPKGVSRHELDWDPWFGISEDALDKAQYDGVWMSSGAIGDC